MKHLCPSCRKTYDCGVEGCMGAYLTGCSARCVMPTRSIMDGFKVVYNRSSHQPSTPTSSEVEREEEG